MTRVLSTSTLSRGLVEQWKRMPWQDRTAYVTTMTTAARVALDPAERRAIREALSAINYLRGLES